MKTDRELFSAEATAFLIASLRDSPSLALVTLLDDWTIADHNAGFAGMIASGENLDGRHLSSLLVPESRDLLTPALAEQAGPVRLNFQTGDGEVLSVDCRIKRCDGGYLLFGEKPLLADNEILRKMTVLNNELTAMTRELNRKNRELTAACAEIRTLSGIIPICMHCKEIRDDQGYWSQLEAFVTRHSEARFSHGICPDCLKQHYPELLQK